jgi:diaminopimelate decarboxylase
MPETIIGTKTNPYNPLNSRDIAKVLANAIAGDINGSTDDAVVFYSLSLLDAKLQALSAAFPINTLHAIAVKANPVVEILKHIQIAGHGAEVASMGELSLALAAGFTAGSIIFDSPVKSQSDLEAALRSDVWINANTLEELALMVKLRPLLKSSSRVGIRINPETGVGKIKATSVAMAGSKFGISINKHKNELTQAFIDYPWLTGIHVHIGSQGMSVDQLLEGIGTVYDFFVDIRSQCNISVFNIGGGLAAKYKPTDISTPFDEYATALCKRCPALFAEDMMLITEFGRSIHTSCGWVASKVECVVDNDVEKSTLFNHVGADMFLRKAYCPNDWHHDLSICDSQGQLRQGQEKSYQVAGPLCFAGDYLSREVSLPAATKQGDILIIHDAGAYTFSMWSLYNSRQFPAIIGYEGDGVNFRTVRDRQSVDDIVAFWS